MKPPIVCRPFAACRCYYRFFQVITEVYAFGVWNNIEVSWSVGFCRLECATHRDIFHRYWLVCALSLRRVIGFFIAKICCSALRLWIDLQRVHQWIDDLDANKDCNNSLCMAVSATNHHPRRQGLAIASIARGLSRRTWNVWIEYCDDMEEVRVRIRDAVVSGSWKTVLRFFWYLSPFLMTRAEEVLW